MSKLTLEEIRAMSDEEIGAALYFAVHTKDAETVEPQHRLKFWMCNVIADYTKDLNAVAEVEKIVIERTSLTDYGRCLVGVTEHHGIGLESTARIATASARERANALLLCLQSAGSEV